MRQQHLAGGIDRVPDDAARYPPSVSADVGVKVPAGIVGAAAGNEGAPDLDIGAGDFSGVQFVWRMPRDR
jgi:hypothetical protein